MGQKLAEKASEPQWLIEKRKAAKQAFEVELLPNRVSHLWKYTDPAIFNPKITTVERVSEIGTWSYSEPGVEVLHILDGIKKYEDLMREKFGSLIDNKNLKFSLLNESTWVSGYFVYIKKNRRSNDPVSLTMSVEKLKSFYPVRNFIYVEDGADVKLIEQVCSQDEIFSDVNIVTEIFLGNGAKLDFINLNMFGNKINYHLIQRANLSAQAQLENTFISLGGNVSKIDSETKLAGEHSVVMVSGIVLGNEKQRFDHHITVNHVASNTISGLDFRVALKDSANSAYTGNLKIAVDALGCDATQKNRNLLLSDTAKAESIPELEILTNDVKKCSHGVTMGHLDEEQIYYLMSRGFSDKEAEKVIIEGFIEPIILKIPEHTLISGQVKSRIEQKLNKD